ncbi:MAG: TldD/PmbA family protein [Burkholderiaceae bacterium]
MIATLNRHELDTREHELHKTRMLMVDGHLTLNARTTQRGLSARAYVEGYWGFASAPMSAGAAGRDEVQRQALSNARALGRFGARPPMPLPEVRHVGRQQMAGRAALTPAECNARLAELHAWCKRRYPGLRATRFLIGDEQHLKTLHTSSGGESLARIDRAACRFTLVGEDASGAPIEVDEIVSGRGSLADVDWSLGAVAPVLDAAHEHLQAKRHAVAARGGLHTVVLAAPLAGMLAHEAMGHPCEADAVVSGAVTASLVGQPVASELITMVDFAHSYEGASTMVPVEVDDEGTPARDVVMIDRGILNGFMHSRETAARLDQPPTGNARAYTPHDEPLVRMRNTAILPGSSTMAQMIEGVDDGYLLMKTGNGQADSTTEFTFGVTLAYEIRGGKLGRAVRNTTLSGSAIKVLKTVDAVGDTMHWECGGYCGKKQLMVVSMGGPALRARAHLGGE